MRRTATTLAVLGIALAASLGAVGSANAVDPIYPSDCIAGGGTVLTLPAPHTPKCIGGIYNGYPVIPPPPLAG